MRFAGMPRAVRRRTAAIGCMNEANAKLQMIMIQFNEIRYIFRIPIFIFGTEWYDGYANFYLRH